MHFNISPPTAYDATLVSVHLTAESMLNLPGYVYKRNGGGKSNYCSTSAAVTPVRYAIRLWMQVVQQR